MISILMIRYLPDYKKLKHITYIQFLADLNSNAVVNLYTSIK